LTLGLHVKTQASKRVISGVILEGDIDSVISTIKHIPEASHDEATQAYEAHAALTTALKGVDVRAAVLLEADYHRSRGLTDGIKDRLRLEGICLAASRKYITLTKVMNGPALGRACNTTKDGALDAASQLGLERLYVEAAAAALAAKSEIL
jgi:hypothetical protein